MDTYHRVGKIDQVTISIRFTMVLHNQFRVLRSIIYSFLVNDFKAISNLIDFCKLISMQLGIASGGIVALCM